MINLMHSVSTDTRCFTSPDIVCFSPVTVGLRLHLLSRRISSSSSKASSLCSVRCFASPSSFLISGSEILFLFIAFDRCMITHSLKKWKREFAGYATNETHNLLYDKKNIATDYSDDTSNWFYLVPVLS